jgi:hypothetical protein
MIKDAIANRRKLLLPAARCFTFWRDFPRKRSPDVRYPRSLKQTSFIIHYEDWQAASPPGLIDLEKWQADHRYWWGTQQQSTTSSV